jgi:hypothetical protein
MTETRTRTADHIRTHPGIHFNALVRALDLAPGQTQYHLKRLLADNTVVAEHLYGRTHYYPPDYNDWERVRSRSCVGKPPPTFSRFFLSGMQRVQRRSLLTSTLPEVP